MTWDPAEGKLRSRLEHIYLPIETSTVPGGPVDTLYNVLKRGGQYGR